MHRYHQVQHIDHFEMEDRVDVAVRASADTGASGWSARWGRLAALLGSAQRVRFEHRRSGLHIAESAARAFERKAYAPEDSAARAWKKESDMLGVQCGVR